MSFGAESTTDDVLAGIDLTGRRYLVTGASTGPGGGDDPGARRARRRGDDGGPRRRAGRGRRGASPRRRCPTQTSRCSASISRRWPTSALRGGAFLVGARPARRADQQRRCHGVSAARRRPMASRLQIGTNHIGHFVLTQLLMLALGEGSRVIALSSAGHRFSDVDLDDPELRAHRIRAVGRVRTIEDRERVVRGRARPASPRAGRARLLGAPRRHHDRAGSAPHRGDASRR